MTVRPAILHRASPAASSRHAGIRYRETGAAPRVDAGTVQRINFIWNDKGNFSDLMPVTDKAYEPPLQPTTGRMLRNQRRWLREPAQPFERGRMGAEKTGNRSLCRTANWMDSLSIRLAVWVAAADVRRRGAARRPRQRQSAAMPRPRRRSRELQDVLARWFPTTWKRFVSARRFLRCAERQLERAEQGLSLAAVPVVVSDAPAYRRPAGDRRSFLR